MPRKAKTNIKCISHFKVQGGVQVQGLAGKQTIVINKAGGQTIRTGQQVIVMTTTGGVKQIAQAQYSTAGKINCSNKFSWNEPNQFDVKFFDNNDELHPCPEKSMLCMRFLRRQTGKLFISEYTKKKIYCTYIDIIIWKAFIVLFCLGQVAGQTMYATQGGGKTIYCIILSIIANSLIVLLFLFG